MFRFFKQRILRRFFRKFEIGDITFDELLKKQLCGAKVIDVRSRQEYDEGHIDGAINIPEYEINSSIKNVLNNLDEELIVYCQSGSRSRKAYKKLIKLNYKNVFNLYGGLDNQNISYF